MQNTPIILKPGKIKNILLFILSLGFVLLGISLLDKNLWLGVLNIVFFEMCFIVSVINFIPGSSHLKMDEKGVEMKSLFKKHFIPWQAVSEFRVKNIAFSKTIVFDIRQELLQNSRIKGKTGAFPDTYGMSPKKLADLLNEYKTKYSSPF